MLRNNPTLQIDPYEINDHPLVAKILQEGWKTYFPLTLLTNPCSRSANFTPILGASNSASDSYSALAKAYASDLDRPEELSYGEFFEASSQLCSMVSRMLHSSDRTAVAQEWRTHYDNLLRRDNFRDRLSSYVKYDIAIRRTWAKDPGAFRPSIFQNQIWQSIIDRDLLELQHTIVAKNIRGAATTVRGSSAFRTLPIKGRGRASFRRSSNSSRPLLCYICGSDSHPGRYCSQTSNNFVSLKDGIWHAPDNGTVCFAFNGGFGCT
jgi:hypothetical protein